MSYEELNKKMAELAFPPSERFRVFMVYPDFIAIDRQFTKEAENHVLSKDPSLKGALKVGTWYRYENIEVLTESLDACFKRLIPLVRGKLSEREYFIFLMQWVLHLEEDEEALSLCKAIEKLVDGGDGWRREE